MHIQRRMINSPSCGVLAALSLLAGMLSAGVAAAAPPLENGAPSAVVRFQDLNLSNPKDVATLYRRISRLARGLCWSGLSSADPTPLSHFDRCYDATMAQATASVGSPALIALYRSGVIIAER